MCNANLLAINRMKKQNEKAAEAIAAGSQPNRPFDNDTARQLVDILLLGKNTYNVWKSRGEIPGKFFVEGTPVELLTNFVQPDESVVRGVITRPLFHWRTILKLKLSDVATLTEKTIAAVCQWELGNRNPTAYDYDLIVKTFQQKLDDLTQ